MSVSRPPDTRQFPSITPMPTDVSGVPAASNNVGPNGSGGGSVGLIVAVVVGGLLLALAVVGVIVLVLVVIRGRKGSKQRTYDVPETCESAGLENPVYSGLWAMLSLHTLWMFAWFLSLCHEML